MTNLILKFQSGSRSGESVLLSYGQSFLVGNEQHAEIQLDDRGVSRQHCKFVPEDGGWVIEDLKSTNGTLINGRQLGGRDATVASYIHRLRTGDVVQIGEATFVAELEVQVENGTEIIQYHGNFEGIPVTEQLRVVPNLQSAVGSGDQKETVLHASDTSGNLPSQETKLPSQLSPTRQIPDLFPFLGEEVLPRRFGNYVLRRVLGSGGMGKVYLAHPHEDQKKLVAIKFLKPQIDQTVQDRARFLREMEISLSLQHPAIVSSCESGDENGQLYIVMEYCSGGNLYELMKRSAPLSLRRAIRLLNRLLSGLEHAHDNGIVHRDLKPPNILLRKLDNGKYEPKISDFGLAKSYLNAGNSDMTVAGSIGGSWAYMPREQLTNFRFVSPESDVWSLAAIFYETLTMKTPRLHSKGSDPIRTILTGETIPIETLLPDLPRVVISFVNTSLAVDPSHRFPDAKGMKKSLVDAAKRIGVDLD